MLAASEIKPNAVISLDKQFHKVMEAVLHAGGGKAGSMVHLKLRSLETGHITERRFNTTDKIEDIEVTRSKMQLLYRKEDAFHFMNLESFEQIALPKSVVGPVGAFLKDNDECEVEFYEERPLCVLHAPVVDLKVESTGEGSEETLKEAVLENNITVLVPHFIKEGDRVHVDVETGKYLDRVSDREAKGAKFSVAAPKVKGEPKSAAPVEPKAEFGEKKNPA